LAAICGFKLEDTIASKPQKYEVHSGGTFVFQLETGEKVELACDECGSTTWCTRYKEGKGGINFMIYCHECGKSAKNISITPLR
jgi:ribosomal protein L33